MASCEWGYNCQRERLEAEVERLRAIVDCPTCCGDGQHYLGHGDSKTCETCLPHRQAHEQTQANKDTPQEGGK